MAGAQRYLVHRDGRFFARLVFPKAPPVPDQRTAMKHLPGPVAVLQDQIGQAERQFVRPKPAPLPYLLAPEHIAASDYARRLVWDDELRTDWQCASTGFTDDQLIADLRDAIAGKRDDPRLQWLIGEQIERFRALGSLAHSLVLMRGAASRALSVSRNGTPFPAWRGATRATSLASLITP